MKQLASLKPLTIQADGRESRASVQLSEQDLPADYLIGPEDALEIMVWKNDVLSRIVTVRPDGKISFPLIGDIEAVGLTPIQLRDRIVVRLKEYMENPVVTVIVQQINSYVIYLMGEIVKPGKYQLKSNTTVLQALTLAGGFTQFASRNKIVIFRREYGRTSDTKIKISYDDIISGGRFENIILKPGDTILVP
jgi:polysaccharide export outer membrane protein